MKSLLKNSSIIISSSNVAICRFRVAVPVVFAGLVVDSCNPNVTAKILFNPTLSPFEYLSCAEFNENIKYLFDKLSFTIGYSDHTLGLDAVYTAVSMGAKIIEKHFTIDKNFSSFRDHSLSTDFKEMSEMVKKIRKIELLKGHYQKRIQTCEKFLLNTIRRAPYAANNIKKGELLTYQNIKLNS